MEIRREPEKVSDRDIENLDRIYCKKYKKGLLLIAGLLMDIAWFLLIVLVMSFTVYRDISTMNPGMATIALFGAIIVWIVLCILTIRFFIKLPIILHKKIAYRSEFLVEETYMKERVIVCLLKSISEISSRKIMKENNPLAKIEEQEEQNFNMMRIRRSRNVLDVRASLKVGQQMEQDNFPSH